MMKYPAAIIGLVPVLVAFGYWVANRHFPEQEIQDTLAPARPLRRVVSPSSPEILAAATVRETGEANSLAIDALVSAALENRMLSREDANLLLGFISSPKPIAMTEGEWEERVNVILNLLRRQTAEDSGKHLEAGVAGLTDILLEMSAANPSRVLRIYAMQHLAQWFPDERDSAKRLRILEVFGKIALNYGDETAGSALMMLSDIHRQAAVMAENRMVPGSRATVLDQSSGQVYHQDVIDWQRTDEILQSASHRLLTDVRADPGIRISAVHVCIDRQDHAALPEIRMIAADATLASTLRKAAIHAIGRLGSEEDKDFLDSLPQIDENLVLALDPAKKALSEKNGRQ